MSCLCRRSRLTIGGGDSAAGVALDERRAKFHELPTVQLVSVARDGDNQGREDDGDERADEDPAPSWTIRSAAWAPIDHFAAWAACLLIPAGMERRAQPSATSDRDLTLCTTTDLVRIFTVRTQARTILAGPRHGDLAASTLDPIVAPLQDLEDPTPRIHNRSHNHPITSLPRQGELSYVNTLRRE